MTTSPPSPTSITHPQFIHLVSLYPSVVKRVYEAKIKDAKKLAQVFEDDAWRYEGLVKLVKGRRGKDDYAGGWLEKAELERLVRWKITHGTNRPFLPAQIRKNEPSVVKSATSAGFNTHKAPANSAGLQFPTEALKHLTTLTGVGPATATLLLSVHDPVDAPFFQDELYHWLCGSQTKLKYNMKEYKELFEKVGEVRQRFGGSNTVRADEVEKVGFVVGHMDVLEKEELAVVLEKGKDVGKEGVNGGTKRLEAKVPVAEKETVEKETSQAPGDGDSKAAPSAKRKRKSAAATETTSATTTRKSKRSR